MGLLGFNGNNRSDGIIPEHIIPEIFASFIFSKYMKTLYAGKYPLENRVDFTAFTTGTARSPLKSRRKLG